MQENGLRTYRPPLDQYVFSNDKIETATTRWVQGVQQGSASRALLLTGPSGFGKTTLALAVAERLGASPRDIRQVNCADLRTLDDARDLIQTSLTFGPSHGTYRTLLLDECHQMVPNAQQAFLTPVESLPKNIILIGCTTAPDMLLKTFAMRFYRIELEPYSVDQLVDILMGLPEPPEPAVAVQAAEIAGGSPRQAIAYIEQGISESQAKEIAEEKSSVEDFIKAIAGPNPHIERAFSIIGRLKPDQYNRFCEQVSYLLENILLVQSEHSPALPLALKNFIHGDQGIRGLRDIAYLYSEIQKLPAQKTSGLLKSIIMCWHRKIWISS